MKTSRILIPLGALAVGAWASALGADPGPRSDSSTSHLPVKEVTVFKDGHAFVVQEGVLPTNETGSVVLDSLPAPVIGTFCAYSAD